MTRRYFTHRYLLLTATLLVVLAGSVFAYTQQRTDSNTITRTENGFSPKILRIPVGTTVTFKNATEQPFWPASDIHPSHNIYAEFDSRGSVYPGESWSFTFDRPGSWSFHDHLASQLAGTIEVFDESGNADFDCSENRTKECWMASIDAALREDGVAAAFDQFVAIHQSNPEFAASCHTYTHDIGLKAFIYHGTDIELTPKTSYCNAGFFHGYLEGLISDASEVAEAEAFCEHVGVELAETFPLAEKQCRHGIGHGIFEHFIVTRADLWGDPQALVQEAIHVCEQTNDEYDDLMRCSSGAFNVYRDFIYLNDEYQEYAESQNLYDVCAAFTEKHAKEGCYWELSKVLAHTDTMNTVFNRDTTEKNEGYIIHEVIPEADRAEYLNFATQSWAGIVGKHAVSQESPEAVINVCKEEVPSDAYDGCFRGIVEGAFTSSEPGREHETLVPLCNASLFDDAERAQCFAQFQSDAAYTYDKAVWQPFCDWIPVRYHTPDVCA